LYAVLGQAVAADARSRKDDVVVSGPHPYGLDDLDQVHPVSLGKAAPFIQKGQNGGPIGIFHDLARLGLDRPVEHGEGKLFHVEHIAQKSHHLGARLGVDPGADPPEIADRGHVLAPGHDPLVGVGEEGLGGSVGGVENQNLGNTEPRSCGTTGKTETRKYETARPQKNWGSC